MTGAARRDRLYGLARADILKSARAQLHATGEVSFRRCAADLGVTAPALYRYFKGVGALEEIVAREVTIAAVVAVGGGGWPAYTQWVADNPLPFWFLAKPQHALFLGELHEAAAGALVGVA